MEPVNNLKETLTKNSENVKQLNTHKCIELIKKESEKSSKLGLNVVYVPCESHNISQVHEFLKLNSLNFRTSSISEYAYNISW